MKKGFLHPASLRSKWRLTQEDFSTPPRAFCLLTPVFWLLSPAFCLLPSSKDCPRRLAPSYFFLLAPVFLKRWPPAPLPTASHRVKCKKVHIAYRGCMYLRNWLISLCLLRFATSFGRFYTRRHIGSNLAASRMPDLVSNKLIRYIKKEARETTFAYPVSEALALPTYWG